MKLNEIKSLTMTMAGTASAICGGKKKGDPMSICDDCPLAQSCDKETETLLRCRKIAICRKTGEMRRRAPLVAESLTPEIAEPRQQCDEAGVKASEDRTTHSAARPYLRLVPTVNGDKEGT